MRNMASYTSTINFTIRIRISPAGFAGVAVSHCVC
jgi:hypothetical protein